MGSLLDLSAIKDVIKTTGLCGLDGCNVSVLIS